MHFSIIIPVYNVAPYLRECLDSVIRQTYTDYEVICINDGSTDESLSILQEYRSRYPQIQLISQENKGLSAARNAGIKVAKGDYIILLDSDDWIEPDMLQTLAEKQHGEDMVCFNGRRYFEDGTQEDPDEGITETDLTGWDYYNKYALKPRKFHFVCVVLRMYKREFLSAHDLWFKEGIFHEDNLFTPIACYYAQSVTVIPDVLYVYRIRDGSITKNFTFQNVVDIVIGTNLLSDFFISKQNINKSTIYRELAGQYIRVFYPDLISLSGKRHAEIRKLTNWKHFKTMAIYPRQKRLYHLIKIHPWLVAYYLKLETFLKHKQSMNA